jgi:hypothetical protein
MRHSPLGCEPMPVGTTKKDDNWEVTSCYGDL